MTVVNFSTEGYLKGQQRLAASLSCKKLMFNSYGQIGSRTHKESPYEFKVASFERGFERDDIVVWLDSSLYQVGDINKIERIILEKGYWFEEAGHYTARWTNDFQREYFKLTEQEMIQGPGGMTLFSAGYMGLDSRSVIAMEFFRQWKAAGQAGAFKGSWETSRHEMTAASIIAQRLGMTYERGGSNAAYLGPGYTEPEPGVTFYLQGIY